MQPITIGLDLAKQIFHVDDKLKRLYRLVEDGLTDTDEVLQDRLNALKADRDRAKAALERAKEQASPTSGGSVPFRKAYLQALVDVIEVDDTRVRKGSKDVLEQAVLATRTGEIRYSQMSTKWRAGRNKTANTYVIEVSI